MVRQNDINFLKKTYKYSIKNEKKCIKISFYLSKYTVTLV